MRYYTNHRFLLLANGTRQPRLTGWVPLREIGTSNKGIRIQAMVDHYPSLHYAFSDVTPKELTREVIPHRMSFVIANTLFLVIGNRMPDIGRLSNYSKDCDVPLFTNFSAYRWTPRTSSRGTNYVCRVLFFFSVAVTTGVQNPRLWRSQGIVSPAQRHRVIEVVFFALPMHRVSGAGPPSLCLPVAIAP